MKNENGNVLSSIALMNGMNNMKEFTLKTGEKVNAPDKCCLFCKHCTDLFYDWHGIYLTMCELEKDIVEGSKGECDYFEE